MAVKLYNARVEFLTLVLMCSNSDKLAAKAFSQVRSEDYFATEWGAAAYRRLSLYMRKEGHAPSIVELIADPALAADHRQRMEMNLPKVKGMDLESCAKDVLSQLDKYRRLRCIHHAQEYIHDSFNTEDGLDDVDDILDKINSYVIQARTKATVEAQMMTFGPNGNVGSVLKDLLSQDKKRFVPTGLEVWDEVNGGFFYGSLVTIGANSGGGKSIMATQLSLNMSKIEPVALVPLEMTKEEMLARYAANQTGVPANRILQGKLSKGERKKIIESLQAFHTKLKEEDSPLHVFKPNEDLGMEDILAITHTLGVRTTMVDYIGLLKGVDGDDSWQALGRAARAAKIYAAQNQKIVILFCQVNEEGRIRYAQAIREHSDVCWVWVATDASKEAGFIDVRPLKSRNQDPAPFTLIVNYESCAITGDRSEGARRLTLTGGDPSSKSDDGKKRGGKKSAGKKDKPNEEDEYIGSIGED